MDYFSSGSRRGGNPPNRSNVPSQSQGARHVAGAPSFESLRAPSNIRIRRLPSYGSRPTSQIRDHTGSRPTSIQEGDEIEDDTVAGRRRSFSAPQRPPSNILSDAAELSRQRTMDPGHHMSTIREDQQATGSSYRTAPRTDGIREVDSGPTTPGINVRDMATRSPTPDRLNPGTATAMRSAGNAAQRSRGVGLSRFRSNTSLAFGADQPTSHYPEEEYEADVIDLLDLVDPEVRTLGTLTNLQNSLFVPDLGGLVNRRPTYELSRRPTADIEAIARSRAGTRTSRTGPPKIPRKPVPERPSQTGTDEIELQDGLTRKMSISSQLSDSHYAVLPHGVHLDGWDEEDVAELNDHVRHLLHSKREGFKRSMRGFRQYVSKPLGLFVTVYAVLVTLFGTAWVFALIGWIYVGGRQEYIINVIDLVLVALFALMGDGLAPFRAVDTYHMCFIAHYHHLTWKLRKKQGLPGLIDRNDLPDRRQSATDVDDIIDKEETAEYSVLTPQQQKRLAYHQAKFNKSHTFYKPHETATHHAFPLRHMVAAVVLLDCHSLLQVALGTCTWSIDYRVRPEALTATILSFSLACNITAGIVISIGDHKTRKKDVLERMFRQGLTEEALRKMAKNHARGEMGLSVDQNQVQDGKIKKAVEAADPKTNGNGNADPK
ncbi:hypothetical protein CKM354_000973200 [Cercospora kikuchii]|uniref:Integral membrane protein n=1 Tax=Cercospora kikuchii TaxID=84275 RepID=A0A9P3CS96_9PEZI|nr:uncharacterized protein CKM354_000973200 [Cercospora kikuchii]GIZ46612.1 hypothetical protein CKM354_000973200 [Cercospora kikuchii]